MNECELICYNSNSRIFFCILYIKSNAVLFSFFRKKLNPAQKNKHTDQQLHPAGSKLLFQITLL